LGFISLNPQSFCRTAVFSFEGIGLVIPIAESMAEPERFPRALSGVMIGVMILFTGSGALAYSAFGSDIQTVVLVNLNQEAKLVQAVQFLYSIAILLSTPLMLFPAVESFYPKLSIKSCCR
jgi:proton-coupled amino acid transporter